MKKLVVILMMLIAIALWSCGNDKSGSSKTVTLTDKDTGAKVTASVNGSDIPEDFPKDIFIVKGTVKNVVKTNVGGKNSITLYVVTEMSKQDAKADIVKNMEANGWKTEMNMGGQQYFTKNDKVLRTAIDKDDDDKTLIVYMASY